MTDPKKVSVTIPGLIVLMLAASGVGAETDFEKDLEEDLEPFQKVFEVKIDKPGGMAFDGRLLFVADRVASKIRCLDPTSGAEKTAFPSPCLWPGGLAFDGKLLWVADQSTGKIFGLDTKKKLVTREIPGPSNPGGMAFDGKHLWVADGKRLHQVSTEDGTTIKSFFAPTWKGSGRGSAQLGLAFKSGYLWVSNRITNKLYRVSVETGDVVDQFPSPGPFPTGLALVGDRLFLADADHRQVDGLQLSGMPRIIRHKPRHETIVLRREVTNRGPGTLKKANIYIAVPHSAPNQALGGEPVFNPTPTRFVEDKWGQKFAEFEVKDLLPGKALEVTMTVETTLFETRYHVDPDRVGTLRAIPGDIRKKYLKDGSKFAITHPSIKKHLTEALGNEKRPYWMIRKIARYIQDNMYYELAGGWNIAPTVIDRGSGSCSEYTFVFMSMCRAAGIPTRYVGAFVVRGDDASTDEVFHRWPEVYLSGYGWVPMDAQAGDKPDPARQGAAFGSLPNRFLITTWGSGGSEYIGWDYNSTAKWVCDSRCDVEDLHIGDWYPSGRGPIKP